MRSDFLNMTAKVSKILHLQKFMYAICKLLLPIQVRKDIDSPEQYLNTISLEKRNSCICNNHIEENPRYDLEIIIPVYNVEKYLEQCVQSIINQQTHYTYKAIFVNDGSTDGSRAILEKYAHYPCVTIIDTPNQGVSAARNLPLKNIDAKYVMYVDSDDYLSQDAVEKLMNKAEETNADIVEGNHVYFSKHKILYTSNHTDEDRSGMVIIHGVAWGKICKAEVWKHLCFPLDYRYEDIMCVFILRQMPVKKASIHDIIYYYRDTPTGFTRAYNSDKRRIETYWLTKQILQDAQELKYVFDTSFYEIFLRHCRVNMSRVAILGDRKADYALFEAQRALRNQYFHNLRAQGKKEKRIESAFLNDNFKEYLLYCLFLH